MPDGRGEPPVGPALRRLRQEVRDYSIKDAATALGWSSAKLSRIETSATRVKPDDVHRLLDLYRADKRTRAEIERLLNERARDSDLAVAVPRALEQYAELEARAARISVYNPMLIPGIVQIPEYAAEVIRATPENEDHLVEQRLNLRMQRQRIFAEPVTLEVILDESVLLRPVGGPGIMRLQMRRLLEVIERPNKSIRVLPLSIGAHPGVAGPFIVLDFSHEEESRVYCDGLTGGVLRSRADEVSRYRACFEALKGMALSASESAAKFVVV